jgi:hypothetical protein
LLGSIWEIRKALAMIQEPPVAAAILDKGTFYWDYEGT